MNNSRLRDYIVGIITMELLGVFLRTQGQSKAAVVRHKIAEGNRYRALKQARMAKGGL
jgi:hypothetical protein